MELEKGKEHANGSMILGHGSDGSEEEKALIRQSRTRH